jgi:hypothetical protein
MQLVDPCRLSITTLIEGGLYPSRVQQHCFETHLSQNFHTLGLMKCLPYVRMTIYLLHQAFPSEVFFSF